MTEKRGKMHTRKINLNLFLHVFHSASAGFRNYRYSLASSFLFSTFQPSATFRRRRGDVLTDRAIKGPAAWDVVPSAGLKRSALTAGRSATAG
jgi:hypothetical protein